MFAEQLHMAYVLIMVPSLLIKIYKINITKRAWKYNLPHHISHLKMG